MLSVAIAVFPFVTILVLAGAAYSFKSAALSDQIEGHRLEIQKVGWIADNAKRLTAELAAANRSLSSGDLLGTGDPDAVAIDLQKSVKTMLDSATMQISSIQPLSVSEEDGIRFVSIRAQASGSYDKVLEFLQSTQRSDPLVLIGALDLMPDPAQQSSDGDTAEVRYIVQFEAVRLTAAKP
jgi:hypothetical protein